MFYLNIQKLKSKNIVSSICCIMLGGQMVTKSSWWSHIKFCVLSDWIISNWDATQRWMRLNCVGRSRRRPECGLSLWHRCPRLSLPMTLCVCMCLSIINVTKTKKRSPKLLDKNKCGLISASMCKWSSEHLMRRCHRFVDNDAALALTKKTAQKPIKMSAYYFTLHLSQADCVRIDGDVNAVTSHYCFE